MRWRLPSWVTPYSPTPELMDRIDPAAWAEALAAELPRVWSGAPYPGFCNGGIKPATLRLSTLTAMGQISICAGV